MPNNNMQQMLNLILGLKELDIKQQTVDEARKQHASANRQNTADAVGKYMEVLKSVKDPKEMRSYAKHFSKFTDVAEETLLEMGNNFLQSTEQQKAVLSAAATARSQGQPVANDTPAYQQLSDATAYSTLAGTSPGAATASSLLSQVLPKAEQLPASFGMEAASQGLTGMNMGQQSMSQAIQSLGPQMLSEAAKVQLGQTASADAELRASLERTAQQIQRDQGFATINQAYNQMGQMYGLEMRKIMAGAATSGANPQDVISAMRLLGDLSKEASKGGTKDKQALMNSMIERTIPMIPGLKPAEEKEGLLLTVELAEIMTIPYMDERYLSRREQMLSAQIVDESSPEGPGGYTDDYLALRRKYLQRTLRDVSMMNQLMGERAIEQPVAGTTIKKLDNKQIDELYGQARSYGIKNPENIPLDKVKAFIDARRSIAPEESSFIQRLGMTLATPVIGGGEAIQRMRDRVLEASRDIPILGPLTEWADHEAGTSRVRQELAFMKENVRKNATEVDRENMSVLEAAGDFATTAVPYAMLGTLFSSVAGVGALGTAGVLLKGQTARSALAWAGATLAMEAGSEHPYFPSESDIRDGLNGELRTPEGRAAASKLLFGNRAALAAQAAVFPFLANMVKKGFKSPVTVAEDANQRLAGQVTQRSQITGEVDPYADIPYADFEIIDQSTAVVRNPGSGGMGGTAGAPKPPPTSPTGGGTPSTALEAQFLRQLPAAPETAPTSTAIAPTTAPSGPSAAITPSGGPIVAYSGTRASGPLMMPEALINPSNHLGPAIYATSSADIGRSYAVVNLPGDKLRTGQSNVRELQLNPSKTFVMEDAPDPQLVEAARGMIGDAQPQTNGELYELISKATGSEYSAWQRVTPGTPAANEFLKSHGIDVIQRQRTERHTFTGPQEAAHTEYAILNPNIMSESSRFDVTSLPSKDPRQLELNKALDASGWSPTDEGWDKLEPVIEAFSQQTGLSQEDLASWVGEWLGDTPPGTGNERTFVPPIPLAENRQLMPPVGSRDPYAHGPLNEDIYYQANADLKTQQAYEQFGDVDISEMPIIQNALARNPSEAMGAMWRARRQSPITNVEDAEQQFIDLQRVIASNDDVITHLHGQLSDELSIALDENSPTYQADKARIDALDARIAQVQQQNGVLNGQLSKLTSDAGLDPIVDKLPDYWTVFRKNPQTRNTPTRDMVKAIGGLHPAVLTPQGDPMLFLHGTGVAYVDPDPSKLMGYGNLAGRGFYISNSPVPTGGNALSPKLELGYAESRAQDTKNDEQYLKRLIADDEATIQQYEEAYAAMEQKGWPSPTAKQDVINVVADLQINLDTNRQKLAGLPTVGPNVRLIFAATRKLFEFDVPWDGDKRTEMFEIVNSIPDVHPDLLTPTQMGDIYTNLSNGVVTNKYAQQFQEDPFVEIGSVAEVYDYLARVLEEAEGHGGNGKNMLNDVLEAAGYDGVLMHGGMRTGGAHHTAINVFDVRRVVPVYMSDPISLGKIAENLGIQMQQAEAIMESPILAAHSQSPLPDQEQVVQAMIASHPGAFTILRGIRDPEKLIKSLNEGTAEGVVKHYRMVEAPNGRLDLLTSSFGEITDDIVDLYKAHGLVRGQQVVNSKTGKVGKFLGVNEKGKHIYKTPFQKGNRVTAVDPGTLQPKPYGEVTLDVPDMYQAFKQFALATTEARVRGMGEVNYQADWFDDEVYRRLQNLTNEFLNKSGVKERASRAAIQRYFDEQRVFDAKALAPEEFAAAAELEQMRDDAFSVGEENDRLGDIHQKALVNGFTLVPNNSKPGYVLSDGTTELKIPFLNLESVDTFLDHLDRGLIDLTPATPLPAEAGEMPNDIAAAKGMSADDYARELAKDAEWMASAEFFEDPYGGEPGGPAYSSGDLYDFGGGSGAGRTNVPPSQPPGLPPGPPPFMAGGAQPPGRPPVPHYSQQFRKAAGSIHEIEAMVTGYRIRLITPMRNAFQQMEDAFHQMGITGLRPAVQFDNIVSGLDRARNEAWPWYQETEEQIALMGSKKLRTGAMYRVFEQHFLSDRLAEASKHKLSAVEAKAVEDLRGTLERMVGAGALRDFTTYIGQVRDRHLHHQFGRSSYDAKGMHPTVQHFASLVADKGLKLQNVDLKTLIPTFIRSTHFAKHVMKPWQETMNQWGKIRNINIDGDKPFAKIGDYVLDWGEYIKRGHTPGVDAGTRAVRTIFRTFLPMSDAQAREVISFVTMQMYRASQGFRVHVLVRDSNQVALSIPFVGGEELASSLNLIRKPGTKAWKEMEARAFKHATIQKGVVKTSGVHGFLETDPTGAMDLSKANVVQRAGGVFVQGAMDVLRDAIPPKFRHIEGTALDPLYLYGNENVWGRMVVGEAAYQRFTKAYDVWDAQRTAAIMAGRYSDAPPIEKLYVASGVDGLQPAARRYIKDLVEGKDREGAAGYYMREVNSEINFIYGNVNKPAALRGNAATMAMTYGNYSMGVQMLLRNTLSRGNSNSSKMRMLALLTGMSAAFEWLHAKTGFNWRNMNPLQSLTWHGSPALHTAVEAFQGYSAAVQIANSQDMVPYPATETINNFNLGEAAFRTLQGLNPTQGLLYEARGLYAASQSPNPAGTLAELFTTGLRDNRHQVQSANEDMYQELLSRNGQVNSHSVAPPERLPGATQWTNHPRDGQALSTESGDLMANIKHLPPQQQMEILEGYRKSQMPKSDSLGGGGGAQ